jgi:hypothetical protein
MAKPETRLAAPLSAAAYRPPYPWAAGVFAGVLALYVLTLAPTTAFWDTSEYIATAHILGIPHPPGNPLFVILGRTWELLLGFLPLATAVKMNLFSATMSAAAAAFWFLVAHRVLAFVSEHETFRRVGAAAAALLSATTFTVWNQSVVNEKVYTVSLFTIAFLTWLAFRWRDRVGVPGTDRWLVLIVYLLALSVGNHKMGLLVAPALVVLVLQTQPATAAHWSRYVWATVPLGLAFVAGLTETASGFVVFAAGALLWAYLAVGRRLRLLAAFAVAGALGLSVQMFLPIRAAQNPVINEADPKCERLTDAAVTILTDGRVEACRPLAESLRRRQYNKPPMTKNPIHARFRVTGDGEPEWSGPPRDFPLVLGQIGMYLQYFNWQWARALGGADPVVGRFRPLVTAIFALLLLYGAVRHFRHDRVSAWTFATLFLTVSAGLVIVLNFKYGYSLRPDLPPLWREVRERDYFFLVSFSVAGLWAGIGLAALWQAFAERWAARHDGPFGVGLRLASPVLVLAFAPLVLNAQRASRAGDYAARDWAYNLLNSVEPYGVLFTNGDNDTFPLWYLQEVEGIRRDVIVIVYSYLATDWYPRQLRDLSRPCDGRDPLATPTVIVCQRPFEPERAAPLYRERDWPAPTRPILGWTDEQITNASRLSQVLDRPMRFTAAAIDLVLPAGTQLLPNDNFLLAIVRQSIGDRPIYFASTTDAYAQFGLHPYLIRRGLAYKLHDGPIPPDTAGLVRIPSGPGTTDVRWLDLEATERLLWQEFVYRDMLDWPYWPDHSTSGIPLQYYRAHWDVAGAYATLGNEPKVVENLSRADRFVVLAFGRPLVRASVAAETAAR